jgi:hypothetical protein
MPTSLLLSNITSRAGQGIEDDAGMIEKGIRKEALLFKIWTSVKQRLCSFWQGLQCILRLKLTNLPQNHLRYSVACRCLQEIEDEAGVLEKGIEKEAVVLEQDLEQGLRSFGKGFTVLEQRLEKELTTEEKALQKEIQAELKAAEKLLEKVGF